MATDFVSVYPSREAGMSAKSKPLKNTAREDAKDFSERGVENQRPRKPRRFAAGRKNNVMWYLLVE